VVIVAEEDTVETVVANEEEEEEEDDEDEEEEEEDDEDEEEEEEDDEEEAAAIFLCWCKELRLWVFLAAQISCSRKSIEETFLFNERAHSLIQMKYEKLSTNASE